MSDYLSEDDQERMLLASPIVKRLMAEARNEGYDEGFRSGLTYDLETP